MQKYFSLKTIPTAFWILLAVVIFGAALRGYKHHDWLRFNADQARDASVVRGFVLEKDKLPLLGPKAGGTEFRLGGAFYYLEILSAEVFGVSPDKVAYPDLAAGIATIALLFWLTRKYFDDKLALGLALVAACSIFLIKYARFAWNPNAGPFYTLLFLLALLNLAQSQAKKSWGWAILAGLALGIGVQLHTLLLVIMPLTTLIFFGYLGFKNPAMWKKAAAVLLVALFLNTGQIVSELQTGGANARAFLGGTTSKTAKSSSVFANVLQNMACQIQSDAFIVSGLGNDDQCGTALLASTFQKANGLGVKIVWLIGFLISVLFTLGGVWFWIKAIKQEREQNKKLFLLLTGTYALLGFLLLIPLAQEISLRFYLAIIFVPFMLLGFWLKQILDWSKKHKKYAVGLVAILLLILVYTNLLMVKIAFADWSGKKQISGSTKSEITLGEAEFVANYILARTQPNGKVLIEGKQKYIFKYIRSLEYFTKPQNVKLGSLGKKGTSEEDLLLVSLGNAKNKGKLSTKLSQAYTAKEPAMHGRFSIVQLIAK